ncbi:hypothetical protein GJ744_002316 [Endocarpon pusillum]|uniref:UBP9-binding protein bun107 n=1 Tax=Endocarpon pusillum TaxID=364733 RepID=A0A8H7E6E3_9EURO|nr:hypothetical protein GJ744_002316 [Endocarpon pusillum]
MARKKRQRISYVLPLAKKAGGHRLGVNGLVIDEDNSILYTGGRDGAICAWDLNLDLHDTHTSNPFSSPEDQSSDSTPKSLNSTKFRRQVQAHTHWVNDIVLTQQNSTLVSASSDVTVKAWRPHSAQGTRAQTIGVHSDYVKCLTTPDPTATWVASGGLDHKIYLWDLNGAGQKLQIDVGKSEGVTKGSIYALRAKGPIIASGGPESVVRIWDVRTGKSITKLVGHTDNVRDILLSEDGDTVMSASSDQTVKVWSLTAGRCLNTLTMHNDSVWCLFSTHPQLSLFYSSDRSGLVAKTDTRDVKEIDEGISLAVLQENDGVHKIVAAGGHIWTTTSSSSINRWCDVNTKADIEPLPLPEQSRAPSSLSKGSVSTSPSNTNFPTTNGVNATSKIPSAAVLRLSVTAPFPGTRLKEFDRSTSQQTPSIRKASEAMIETDLHLTVPIQALPEETIQGQNGLIKHVMLNDRKRVLTLDSTGEVVLWDLLKCMPIKSFGKQHLEDVVPMVNTVESVANWCAVDTRTGRLSVMLEENYCFDAEVYADETDVANLTDFREDQRINLGKWVLRNLFAALIEEEIKRDEAYRKELLAKHHRPNGLQRGNAPLSIMMPGSAVSSNDSQPTPRPLGGSCLIPGTPGLSIGVASPSGAPNHVSSLPPNHLQPTAEEDHGSEQDGTTNDQASTTGTRPDDYFSPNPTAQPSEASSECNQKLANTLGDKGPDALLASPVDDKDEKKKGSLFGKGKNFKMTFPSMKLSRISGEAKPVVAPQEDKSEDASDKSSEKEERTFEDSFYGVIQRIRHDYDEQIQTNPDQPPVMGVTSSLLDETPVLRQPPHTLVLIQEDSPEAGGVVDLYGGAIGTLGADTDIVEKIAPAWLGDLLLRNHTPYKETVKVSFTLQPLKDELPSIATADGRLNANRMLRAKKILAYVAERIEAQPTEPEENPMKVEEYLELYCHDQLVPPNMTLATLRTHIWRTGGDVALFYRANGKKVIAPAPPEHPLAVANGHSSPS